MTLGDGFWDPLDTAATSLDGLSDVDTTTVAPADGDVLLFDGALWVPGLFDVENAGRWEVVVNGVPAEEVTNTAGDDWLYVWVGA